VKAEPRHGEAWNNLGWTYFTNGKLDQSIDALQTALRVNARHVRALVNLTQAFAKKKETARARETCDQLSRVDPTIGAEVRLELGL
jgi:cytochrome c-type biogenesis protein CcmH/NrfG